MASLVSSVFTSVGTLPFDNIKTKLQSQSKGNISPFNSKNTAPDADLANKPYRGILDCLIKSI